ncbi:hypothetical protein GCM10025875_04610 [Litorihabitans aurantiacus]|uniref:G5 domain-containing protein n=1 Tax=Litorihabitans aurantiacus TaxID=1930061 RepID=A0AA37ULX6_9MICO|nr:hypothetical protein GCM10025875_04610 [Litorihabitans aurantiacus]
MVSTARRGVRIGLHTVVLAALVAGTGTVVVSQLAERAEAEEAALAANPEVAGVAESAPADLPVGALSADAPLVADASGQLQHIAPASRSQARTALADGVTFTVVVDGESTEITSAAATLAEALEGAGVVIGWDDEVSVDLASAPQPGAEVRVGRVSTQFVTDEVVTEHETEERRTSSLLEGETRVVQEGVDGSETVTAQVRLVDGVEVSRTTMMSARTSDVVTEIVEVGTRRPAPAATAAPSTTGGSGGSAAPAAPVTPVDPGTSRAIAKDMVLARGWGRTSGPASTSCGRRRATGTTRRRTPAPAPTASRSRSPAARWRRPVLTGARTRRPRSPGA